MIVAALALYLWGVRRNNALHPRHPWSVGKTAAWIGALVHHRRGHLQLRRRLRRRAVLGPHGPAPAPHHGGRPALRHRLAPASWPGAPPSGTAHLVVTEALRSRVAKFLGHPIVAFVLYAVVIPISHLTIWYNYTLEHESVHNAEHLVFLARGLPVLAPDLRERPQLLPPPPRAAVLLPLHGHPDRHLHRAVAGRRDPGDVPRLLRHPPDLGPVLRRRPPRRAATSCGWWATR